MKSYDQFVNESIVGKLAGFAGRAARGAKKLGGKRGIEIAKFGIFLTKLLKYGITVLT